MLLDLAEKIHRETICNENEWCEERGITFYALAYELILLSGIYSWVLHHERAVLNAHKFSVAVVRSVDVWHVPLLESERLRSISGEMVSLFGGCRIRGEENEVQLKFGRFLFGPQWRGFGFKFFSHVLLSNGVQGVMYKNSLFLTK